MDAPKGHFRAMMFYDFKCGLNETECIQRLIRAYGDSAPSRATVFRWFAEFKGGRVTLEDEERSGRPNTAVTLEKVVAAEKILR